MTRSRYIAVGLLGLLMAACSQKGDEQAEAKPEAAARLRTVLEKADSATVVSLVAGDTLHVSRATIEFYQKRRWAPAWIKGRSLTDQGQKMAETLRASENDGLSPLRYRYDVLQKMVVSLDAKGDADVDLDETAEAHYGADVDLLLTEAFTRYTRDLAEGSLNPNTGDMRWNIPRGAIPKGNILRALARGGEPAEIVNRIRPNTPQYGRLMKVLARLNEVKAKGGWTIVPDGNAKRGDSSDVVIKLRERLGNSEDIREATYAQRGMARPAFFDRDLFLAVQHFQQRHAIDDDGSLGARTIEELNHPVEDRIAEVKINLDRWRWLPHDLGKMYVLVNVAGFEMSVIENNRAIESMNVVVGQTGWETPIFADTLESMVVNPSWNVPPSILAEEMANLANDPAYLARNNFVRTKEGGLRQLPGPKNALGQYKFLFPNKDNIYLHDTPADALFSRASRAFSHGCIRLERPRDLAYLLGSKLGGKSAQQIDAMTASGDETHIRFRKKIPVYILYFTTWVDDDGTTRFHHDVYGHDEALDSQKHRFDSRAT